MRRSTGLPTLIINCRPCHDAGRERNLAEFDLGPDGPSQTHHTLGRWSGDVVAGQVHLRRPCGHAPRAIRQQQITDTLAAITGKLIVYL